MRCTGQVSSIVNSKEIRPLDMYVARRNCIPLNHRQAHASAKMADALAGFRRWLVPDLVVKGRHNASCTRIHIQPSALQNNFRKPCPCMKCALCACAGCASPPQPSATQSLSTLSRPRPALVEAQARRRSSPAGGQM